MNAGESWNDQRAAARYHGLRGLIATDLGLTPQALRLSLLRRLSDFWIKAIWLITTFADRTAQYMAVLFRAFLMTEFAKAAYSKAVQVLIPGLAFGLSHAGDLNLGFLPWLGIMVQRLSGWCGALHTC